MSKPRAAMYLSVDIGAGEGIADVHVQLRHFDRVLKKGKYTPVKLYADVMTDERVHGFGDKAVECAEAIVTWAKERGIECKPAISIAHQREPDR